MDNFERFYEDKLPDSSRFISEKNYQTANNIWNVFKMNTVGNYHDLYLKTDVFFVADVSEKFINTCLDYYGLGPCHNFSIPGLSCDTMLKMTGTRLELMSDTDMHLFIEKGMRRGISYISKRHSKANKKYLKCYDRGKESTHITYLDANYLYGCTMSQYLPYSEFKWLNKEVIMDLMYTQLVKIVQ